MRGSGLNLSPALGFVAVLTALPSAPAAAAQAAAESRCATAVQGKIAWNYGGNKNWSAANIARLCKGAEGSAEPARCFRKVMHGGVNWGGGTRWEWRNAIELCRGARNASARISCFKKKVANETPWQQAIRQCRKAGSPGLTGRLHARPQTGVRELRRPDAKDREFDVRKEESGSGSVRFGDGEHGRRPPRGDRGQVRPGAGPSSGITDRPSRERDLDKKGAARLSANPDMRERVRLRPRVTGYRPSTVMTGGEVLVQGRMFGKSKGRRRLILGVHADPDHGLARELRPLEWTPGAIRTRLPGNILPAKYFIALAGPDGEWVTNRLKTLRVLKRQRVSVKSEIDMRCYADVLQYPRRLRVTFEPVKPENLGMDSAETISVRLRYARIREGKFGRRYYTYAAQADLPHGLFEGQLERPDGARRFKARDWSRAENARGYEASKPCAAHRRIDPHTGQRLEEPPVYIFKIFGNRKRRFRIGPRTRQLEFNGLALADPAELGALPPPTPVDE